MKGPLDLRFADIKTSSDQFLQAGVRNLIEDLAGTGRIDGGPPCHCGLRWLPTLHSDPPLPLRAYPVPGDPVGFIQVDNGAIRDFTIYNGD